MKIGIEKALNRGWESTKPKQKDQNTYENGFHLICSRLLRAIRQHRQNVEETLCPSAKLYRNCTARTNKNGYFSIACRNIVYWIRKSASFAFLYCKQDEYQRGEHINYTRMTKYGSCQLMRRPKLCLTLLARWEKYDNNREQESRMRTTG